MKQKFIYAAAMAAMLASCSSDDLSLATKSAETEAPGVEGAVNFSAYTPRSITRAGYAGLMNDAQLAKTKALGGGFGVFGYYTDQQDYDLQISKPNFMYNQGVFWKGAAGTGAAKWIYEPVKYWPNEYGSDAVSQDIDKVSFFAYAPYVDVNSTTGKVTGDEEKGITAVSRNTNTGDPLVWYKGSFKPVEAVDLCWATVADDALDWTIIQDNGVQRFESGLPWLNVQRPKEVEYDNQKLKFQFRHALAQLNIQIDADPDITTSDETTKIGTLPDGTTVENSGTTKTKVYVRSITINGLASKGSLNLNNIVANEPLWQSYYGSGNIYSETATITDGRRDGKEGVTGATATNETLTGLNPVIISNDGNTSAGVTHAPVNLFESNTLTDAIYVIPTGDPVSISIVYDVETADDNLATTLSDGTTRGSSIENKITKEVVFGTDEYLKAGNKYTLKLHLGMNSVKFSAIVGEWEPNEGTLDGETWQPNNTAKGVTLNKVRVAISEAETLTATVVPDDVTNKEIVWSSSNEELATVTDGVVTPKPNVFGEVTISAYNPGTGKTAECTVLITQKASAAVTTAEQKALWFGKVIGTDGLLYATSAQATSYGCFAAALLCASKLGFALSNYGTAVHDDAAAISSNDYASRYGNVSGATWRLPTVLDMQAMFSGYGANGATVTLTVPNGDTFTATGYHKKYDGTSGEGSGADQTTFDCSPATSDDGAVLWTWSSRFSSNVIVPYGNIRNVPTGSGYVAPSASTSAAIYWLQDTYGSDKAIGYDFYRSYFWAFDNSGSLCVRPVLAF